MPTPDEPDQAKRLSAAIDTPGALEALTSAGMQVLGADPITSAFGGLLIGTAWALDRAGFPRRLARGQQAIDVAAAEVGGEDRLVELATGDDARLELTMRVLEAAARTTLQDKIGALGRVLAQGLQGDTVDPALMLAHALEDLEAPHVRVLERIARDGSTPKHDEPAPNTGAIGMSPERLQIDMPGDRAIIDALIASLSLHGLIRDIAIGSWSSVEGRARYVITSLGTECLGLLDVRGLPHPSLPR